MGQADKAEEIALQALGWMAEDGDRIGRFLGATGLAPGDLRALAQEPEFLAAVLDFVLAEDAHVLALAARTGLAPEAITRARTALPGGNLPHWT